MNQPHLSGLHVFINKLWDAAREGGGTRGALVIRVDLTSDLRGRRTGFLIVAHYVHGKRSGLIGFVGALNRVCAGAWTRERDEHETGGDHCCDGAQRFCPPHESSPAQNTEGSAGIWSPVAPAIERCHSGIHPAREVLLTVLHKASDTPFETPAARERAKSRPNSASPQGRPLVHRS